MYGKNGYFLSLHLKGTGSAVTVICDSLSSTSDPQGGAGDKPTPLPSGRKYFYFLGQIYTLLLYALNIG